MSYRPQQILDGLYIGCLMHARNVECLNELNITHLLSILTGCNKFLPDKYYLCIKAEDSVKQDLVQYFSVCNDFIHAARLESKNVLVHCLAGVSRSVTVVCAYLMTISNIGMAEALRIVRSQRTMACPNMGFQEQLKQFEINGLKEERERLKMKFPNIVLKEEDEERCNQFLQLCDMDPSNESQQTIEQQLNGMFSFSIMYPPSERKPSQNSKPVKKPEGFGECQEISPNVYFYSPETRDTNVDTDCNENDD